MKSNTDQMLLSYMPSADHVLPTDRELVVDGFAGGGGASEGIKRALGRDPDIAINHDMDAIIMHEANHPDARHYCENIWTVDPIKATQGLPVGLAWFSPDCTHFSRAKGGKPVKKEIRGLAWVVVEWAKKVRPRVIILENVAEFQTWGPLDENNQPDKSRSGETFKEWVGELRKLGYNVEWQLLKACDYGAPTIRKRLFLVARCDGDQIVWPEPTHGPNLKPYRTAAECIDWSIACPSIFERKRPLVEKTLIRIARGIQKFVIEAKEPFIVGIDNQSSKSGNAWATSKPLNTIVKENRFAVVAPCLTKYHGLKADETRGQRLGKPIKTLDTQNRFGLVTAYLAKYFGGVIGAPLDKPTPTVTAIDHNALVAAHLTKFYGTNIGSDMREPMPTVTATGQHIAEVRAFLVQYNGCSTGQKLTEPMHTVTSKDRMGLVTIAGIDYQIADIGLRMLKPRELALSQGFDDDYVLTGNTTNQVARIGNSVSPHPAEALVRANVEIRAITERIAV